MHRTNAQSVTEGWELYRCLYRDWVRIPLHEPITVPHGALLIFRPCDRPDSFCHEIDTAVRLAHRQLALAAPYDEAIPVPERYEVRAR